jgi:hypothetical protein
MILKAPRFTQLRASLRSRHNSSISQALLYARRQSLEIHRSAKICDYVKTSSAIIVSQVPISKLIFHVCHHASVPTTFNFDNESDCPIAVYSTTFRCNCNLNSWSPTCSTSEAVILWRTDSHHCWLQYSERTCGSCSLSSRSSKRKPPSDRDLQSSPPHLAGALSTACGSRSVLDVRIGPEKPHSWQR